MASIADILLRESRQLADACAQLTFTDPVWTVYNAYRYALPGFAAYVRRYGNSHKRVLYLGMNPGPWGMAQTGVPFGEIPAVRDWMGLVASIGKPVKEHPKRIIEGLSCTRSEVSGRRLWGLFAEIYDSAEAFFDASFVLNYCPLSFIKESGANLTPDKLPAKERAPLEAVCDKHLQAFIKILQPSLLVGVGGWATKCLERNAPKGLPIGTLLHPSPASPIANKEWPQRPIRQLKEMGII